MRSVFSVLYLFRVLGRILRRGWIWILIITAAALLCFRFRAELGAVLDGVKGGIQTFSSQIPKLR